MRKVFFAGLAIVAALAVAVPVSFAATFFLWPLWSWVERALGVEAIGHSAPAAWCFIVSYAALAGVAISVIVWRASRVPRPV